MSKLEKIKHHIKTHSVRSAEDIAAVSTLESFLRSDGKINPNFADNDKWPNTDGTFEFVSNPEISRKPEQNFFVQIKGTHNYDDGDGIVKYSLKSLAFPAFIFNEVTSDPGILFVVLNPDRRGEERVFWMYVSIDFLNSIDFEKDSKTISFTLGEEIKNTDESIEMFCKNLSKISSHHTFVKKLEGLEYSESDVLRLIDVCDKEITEKIDRLDIYNETRDNVSKKLLSRLYDLCSATLLLNSIKLGNKQANLQLAWEQSMLNIKTKYLGDFLKGLTYIGKRIPQEGQSERLLLKYYDFLWQIRDFLKSNNGIKVLSNLEKFPLVTDETDKEFYIMVANAIEKKALSRNNLKYSRYYIQKKTPFFIGSERYYEITLQLAETYATKFNRLTVYSKENIFTDYSIKIGYEERNINLWEVETKIKIVTSWEVSIAPSSLNKLAKILYGNTKINSKHGEYVSLMNFLTNSGINLLDLIDLSTDTFGGLVNKIYAKTNTTQLKDILLNLHKCFSKETTKKGKNVLRYLLLNLREEDFEKVLPNQFAKKLLCDDLYISSRCFPFENKPYISNLVGSKTSNHGSLQKIIGVAGIKEFDKARPYILLQNAIKETGEIYFEDNLIGGAEEINLFNNQLDDWEAKQGYKIKNDNGLACIDSYENTTISILEKLLSLSKSGNAGQSAYNKNFIEKSKIIFEDKLKELTIKNAFVNSKILMIYGAAGTGKTLLINYLSNLMGNKKKLFLTKTHTARQNLQRRIENPGVHSNFISIDSFTKRVELTDYDVIFVDECSTIDNRTMEYFLNKIGDNTFLVLAGDIHQIESIDFGNWFYYTKELVTAKGASIELLNTWRTKDKNLIKLWDEVRNKKSLITEKLVIDGPFSEEISKKIFEKDYDDEVVLCLNYDGKFGLNNINTYFQNANHQGEPVSWREWTYKVGDRILFNDSDRFTVLYNNLKGRIVKIDKDDKKITFIIDVDTILTENDCNNDAIDYFDTIENSTRIGFSIFAFDPETEDMDEEIAKNICIVPFQLAYAVSIHKAQGLEYDSVKIIIPSANAEKITHSIFYTAITRAKKKLKIYWSSETMKEIVKSFSIDKSNNISLEIIKSKLNC